MKVGSFQSLGKKEELTLATQALAAEDRAVQRLDEYLEAREPLASLASRSERRQGFKERLAALEPDEAPEAREAWKTTTERLWQLARSARRLAQYECRRRHVKPPLTQRDLNQEAMIGLFEAATRFDPQRDLRFSTYARWWIRAHLNRVSEHGRSSVRVPNSAAQDLRRLHQARQILSTANGTPSRRRVAARAGLAPERAQRLEALGQSQSLDLCPPNSTTSFKERIPATGTPFSKARDHELVDHLEAALGQALDERDQYIVHARYGLEDDEPCTFREIGEALDLTGERVRQLHRQAVVLLREQLGA